jgi:hypothetical protein
MRCRGVVLSRVLKWFGAAQTDARKSERWFSRLDGNIAMKHDYFIEDLGQAAGWFKPHRHRYSCLRCGWMFVVEGSRGAVIALDESGVPLPQPLNAARVQTFVDGPCMPSQYPATERRQPACKKSVLRNLRPLRGGRADTVTQTISAK